MTDKMAIRTFPTAYKLKAIKRSEEGEGVLPVARKLGISRKLLHDWIKAWKAHGPHVALTDTELLTACVNFTFQHTHEAEQQTFNELETSGATRLVNTLRVSRLQ